MLALAKLSSGLKSLPLSPIIQVSPAFLTTGETCPKREFDLRLGSAFKLRQLLVANELDFAVLPDFILVSWGF